MKVMKLDLKKESKMKDGLSECCIRCEICDFKCENIITFNKHKNINHKEQTHHCKKCNKMFQINDMLKKHLVEIHEDILKYATQGSWFELKECSL